MWCPGAIVGYIFRALHGMQRPEAIVGTLIDRALVLFNTTFKTS